MPSLALLKSEGSIRGMQGSLNEVTSTGSISFNLPLPTSAGRGFSPQLTLNYSSEHGNSVFGLGWQLAGVCSISRRTNKGTPNYGDDKSNHDEFIAPDGEVLVPALDEHGQRKITEKNSFRSVTLSQFYQVERFLPRTENHFNRIERWTPKTPATTAPFWLVQSAEGNLHLYGISALGRIADPNKPNTRIARWLLQESLNSYGEHIVYHYRAEDQHNIDFIDLNGDEKPRDSSANRYLTRINYANVTAHPPLYLLPTSVAQTDVFSQADFWHCQLDFNYGEDNQKAIAWPTRLDPFSDYAFGFEIRTHRLCHQITLSHTFADEPNMKTPSHISQLLLNYQQNQVASYLQSVQQRGSSCDAKQQTAESNTLPAIQFRYRSFDAPKHFASSHYRAFELMPPLQANQPYQLIDLYGEGVPGILSRDVHHWCYSAPERAPLANNTTEQSNTIAYGAWQTLPLQPPTPAQNTRQQKGRKNTSQQSLLTDITGDGCLDWVIFQPGLNGFFTLKADRTWSSFIPFTAFPTELLHPNTQFANLMGNGRADMALIGTNSVRLYANKGAQGYRPMIKIAHHQDNLPILSNSAAELVAFSDMLGSGQQHLVRIRYNLIECWPNLGRGRFGQAITLATLPFDKKHFNPARLFLADIDGSGATDVIYAEADRFRIFHNQGGNQLIEIASLGMPEGERYDNVSQVSFADLTACGCSSLIVSFSHPKLRHWRYDFAQQKPYLLDEIDQACGSLSQLHYRSSAQEWLDEKQQTSRSLLPAISQLPFARQLIKKIVHQDLISGNTFSQHYQYRQGFYDAIERDFCGFGLILQTDSALPVSTAETSAPSLHSPPLLKKTWYHTGQHNGQPPVGYDRSDSEAITLAASQFTRLVDATGYDQVITDLDPITQQDMQRALRGRVRRCEIFSLANEKQAAYPYTVSETRYRLRQRQAKKQQRYGVTLCLPLERLHYNYERMPQDPRADHLINLKWDAYGYLTQSIQIHYPRRAATSASISPTDPHYRYWQDSFDAGQNVLRIKENQARWQHSAGSEIWRLGLPYETRIDVLEWSAEKVKQRADLIAGCGYESFIDSAGMMTATSPLQSTEPRVMEAYQRHCYMHDLPPNEHNVPPSEPTEAIIQSSTPPEALFAYSDTAELDPITLEVYAPYLTGEQRQNELKNAGYRLLSASELLPTALAANLWTKRENLCEYSPPTAFRRLVAHRANTSVGKTHISYDQYWCLPTLITDALKNIRQASYDYRYLLPIKIIDANNNTHEATYDTLGRLSVTTFYGYQDGKLTGFSPLTKPLSKDNLTSLSLEQAIANPQQALQGRATLHLYDPWAWYSRRQPVHSLMMCADRYPNETDAQIRIQLVYADGFGRRLQSKQKTSDGSAWQATENGLVCTPAAPGSQSRPISAPTTTRWWVSERREYDHKGLIIRTYQPYFLNTHRYIKDEILRELGLYQTHYYDALGRMIKTQNAKGYFNRTIFFAWFVMQEDENDTWHEMAAENTGQKTS